MAAIANRIDLGRRLPGQKAGTTDSSLQVRNVSSVAVSNSALYETNIRMLAQVAQRQQIIPPNNIIDLNSIAIEVMSLMGCSPVYDRSINTAEYSLVDNSAANNTEQIKNPNKIDISSFQNLKAETILINDIFKNTQDSIFQLDEALPLRVENSQKAFKLNQENTNYSIVVNKLIELNFLGSSMPAIRAFGSI
tara:strand:+ start:62766 stop:63344 length:579 start_codon:yes stop_codon:yes gene_type:complete